jgi:hypothetical protein
MATKKELNEALEHDDKRLIAASLVDLESGMTLATELTCAAPLGIAGSIDDKLISLSDHIYLIKLVRN